MRKHTRVMTRWPALALATALTVSGCSQISAQMQDAQEPGSLTSTPKDGPVLVTQQWGVLDGMLSVLVTNTTSRTLHYAQADITARGATNVLVATSRSSVDGRCCAVIDLPPGQKFGFYFDVGPEGETISEIDVVYRDVTWASSEDPSLDTTFAAKARRVTTNSVGAVVVAEVTTTGGSAGQATAQAFLNDANGDFLAVVSGRWDCFTPGKRLIRMQLFHTLPPGAVVDSVVMHPVTEDPARPDPKCPAITS